MKSQNSRLKTLDTFILKIKTPLTLYFENVSPWWQHLDNEYTSNPTSFCNLREILTLPEVYFLLYYIHTLSEYMDTCFLNAENRVFSVFHWYLLNFLSTVKHCCLLLSLFLSELLLNVNNQTRAAGSAFKFTPSGWRSAEARSHQHLPSALVWLLDLHTLNVGILFSSQFSPHFCKSWFLFKTYPNVSCGSNSLLDTFQRFSFFICRISLFLLLQQVSTTVIYDFIYQWRIRTLISS